MIKYEQYQYQEIKLEKVSNLWETPPPIHLKSCKVDTTILDDRFTVEQKIQIILESLKVDTNTAELCQKHNIHPKTLDAWRKIFMDGGRSGLKYDKDDKPVISPKNETALLRRIAVEKAMTIGILKKILEENSTK